MTTDYLSKIIALTGLRIQEAGPCYLPSATEHEIQARWYGGQFGENFKSTEGKEISILDFGRWNHESGPDFKDCKIQIEGSEPVFGDIEIDLDARSWERHGHATNPAYNDVALHVFITAPVAACFARTELHRHIPQIQLQAQTVEEPKRTSAQISVVSPTLMKWRDEEVVRFLESAARYRMEVRGQALARTIAVRGEQEALYQAIASALGYKNNQIPFLLLAQRSGLTRREGIDGEALLFGLAGFLDGGEFHLFDPKSRSYQRELWDSWWSMRSQFDRLILDADAWSLTGCRPANHPHRRVAALACINKKFTAIFKTFSSGDMAQCIGEFNSLHHPFWEQYWTLASDSLPRKLSLIGEQRINEILTNVFFPYRLMQFQDGWDAFSGRTEAPYRRLREDLLRFFGPRPKLTPLLRKCVIQQGLLQVVRDLRRAL
ncbi:MAG: DUF2851 family protein [Chthoniobacterales bacterium]